jgi:GntR family transcriptional regulator/MocR family aminotransferase
MRIPIQRGGQTPMYLQIENFLRQNILAGSLAAGTRLPSTRLLADELGVSQITVKNAYADLESEGLIGAIERSGTYILPVEKPASRTEAGPGRWPDWQEIFASDPAETVAEVQPSPRRTGIISFTGVGAPQEYPLIDFYHCLRAVIQTQGFSACEYGELNGGYLPLRATIAQILSSQGIRTLPEQVLITSGSQQALALTCQTLLKAGDAVIVEEPTYNLALELFKALQLKVIGVPCDANGMQVERLEAILSAEKRGLIYTIPNFQNPGGFCLSTARRIQLVELAGRFNVPILEDDYAGDLRYDGRALPAIKALDPGGRVIYAGTFSKMLMPGLRTGYLTVEGPVFARLLQAKRVHDLTTSTLLQRALHEYVTVGRYQVHLRRSCRIYRKRRDAMLTALRKYLPGASFTPPQGGLFLWLRLPPGTSSTRLLERALAEGIEFAPGTRFFNNPQDGEPYLRLNFAVQPPEQIEIGIRRLGRALQ